MLQFFRENYRIILLTILALIAGTVIGLFIGLTIAEPDEPVAETGNTGVVSLLPGAVIEKYVRFESCGHTLCIPVESNPFVGYTEEELAAFYEDGTIDVFRSDYAAISFVHDGYCPEHYVLGLMDGLLCVYRTSAETFAREVVSVIQSVSVSEFTEEERAALTEGIAFDTLGEIDAYLENAES